MDCLLNQSTAGNAVHLHDPCKLNACHGVPHAPRVILLNKRQRQTTAPGCGRASPSARPQPLLQPQGVVEVSWGVMWGMLHVSYLTNLRLHSIKRFHGPDIRLSY